MNCALLIVVVILIMSILSNTKGRMISGSTKIVTYDAIANQVKTGDLVLMMNRQDKVTDAYLIYKHGVAPAVALVLGRSGYLEKKSIPNIVSNHKHNVYVLPLRRQVRGGGAAIIEKALRAPFASYGKSNCVLTYIGRRFRFHCSAYVPILMTRLGIMDVGINYACIYNYSPECYQAFYNTSVYIDGNYYSKTPFLLKDRRVA